MPSIQDAFRALKAQNEAQIRDARGVEDGDGRDIIAIPDAQVDSELRAVRANVVPLEIPCERNGFLSLKRSSFASAFPDELFGKVPVEVWETFISKASDFAAAYPMKYTVTYLMLFSLIFLSSGIALQVTADEKEDRGEEVSGLRAAEKTVMVSFAIMLLWIAYIFYTNVYYTIPRVNKALGELVAETSLSWHLHEMGASFIPFSWVQKAESRTPLYAFDSIRLCAETSPKIIFYTPLVEAEEILTHDGDGDIDLAIAAS